jgi:hypothetical protein
MLRPKTLTPLCVALLHPISPADVIKVSRFVNVLCYELDALINQRICAVMSDETSSYS